MTPKQKKELKSFSCLFSQAEKIAELFISWKKESSYWSFNSIGEIGELNFQIEFAECGDLYEPSEFRREWFSTHLLFLSDSELKNHFSLLSYENVSDPYESVNSDIRKQKEKELK